VLRFVQKEGGGNGDCVVHTQKNEA
jgi:hypothetical protein